MADGDKHYYDDAAAETVYCVTLSVSPQHYRKKWSGTEVSAQLDSVSARWKDFGGRFGNRASERRSNTYGDRDTEERAEKFFLGIHIADITGKAKEIDLAEYRRLVAQYQAKADASRPPA